MKLENYINDLIAHGRCSFTLNDAEKQLGKTRQSIILAIEHLRKKHEIVSPAKGFYVIVTPEYRIYDCLPAEFFIPYLMEYWRLNYYSGLLTAAMYQGASHQAPQTFQVVIEKNRPDIHCGKVRVQFIKRRSLTNFPTQTITTAKSMLKISAPEVTAMDLLCYPHRCGGLNHIATVLSELWEHITPQSLATLLEIEQSVSWKQRLGYLLEIVDGSAELIAVLKDHLATQKRVDYIPLMPGLKRDESSLSRNTTWKIIENTTIESDI